MMCPRCLEDKPSGPVCPRCTFDESSGPKPMCLPFRHRLQGGGYVVGVILGSPGGFGVAYKALYTKNRSVVVIKEHLGPASKHGSRGPGRGTIMISADHEAAYERSLSHFQNEARALEQFDHPNIVRVIEVFDENNTSYYTMPFVDGSDLAQLRTKAGAAAFKEAEVLTVAKDMLAALAALHKLKTLHCDIKPSNIILTDKKKKAILIDFGAARRIWPQDPDAPVLYSKRFAPLELCNANKKALDVSTDIYLLCATLYDCLTGSPPPMAEARQERDTYVPVRNVMPKVDRRLADLIDAGLAMRQADRPQSAANALKALAPEAPKLQVPSVSPNTAKWWSLSPAALLLLLGIVYNGTFLLLAVLYAGGWFAVQILLSKSALAHGVELSLVSNGTNTVVRTLKPGEAVNIGRGPTADIRIANKHLTSLHASVIVQPTGTFVLKDLRSLNHTFAQPPGTDAPPENWKRIAQYEGKEGKFILGDLRFGGVRLDIRQAPLSP